MHFMPLERMSDEDTGPQVSAECELQKAGKNVLEIMAKDEMESCEERERECWNRLYPREDKC